LVESRSAKPAANESVFSSAIGQGALDRSFFDSRLWSEHGDLLALFHLREYDEEKNEFNPSIYLPMQ
jgi:hypothetical protein